MLWMIPSCRSWLIRSRSSTTARRWTCSCRRAFSIAIAGVAGERLDERLVGRGELLPGRLVGEVQVADRAALHRHRDAEEAVHLRMVRREPVASLVEGDVGDPDRAVLADDQAEEAVTARQGADPRPCLAVHAGGDEGLDHPAGVDDPERGIARADQRTDLVDDDLEHLLDGAETGDRPGGDIDRVVDVGRRLLIDATHDDRG